MTDPDPLPRLAVLVAVTVVFTASAIGGYTTYGTYADEETVGGTFQAASDFGTSSVGNVESTSGSSTAGNSQDSSLTAAGNSPGDKSTSEVESNNSTGTETESNDGGVPDGDAENDTAAVVTTVLLAAPVTGGGVEDNPPSSR